MTDTFRTDHFAGMPTPRIRRGIGNAFRRGLWLAAGAVALAVGLAAGFGWVLEREERRLIEIERRARADAAEELGRLRAERARLQARLPGAEERRRLEEEQAALVRLRAEVEAMRKRTWPGGRN